ncbi:uncharacterized protein NPIL_462671 [Nephila pilipes]|uniref:Uncharacterized protein n=1 Tax=Nephila pilipes TaxID=299642 RepID=A0A8X6TAM0_NEPPI|nr:uncharacterized protein NPIL_462671 [Nephila pilipes]
MNLQQYSTIYSRFHGAFEFQIYGDTIVIPLDDVSWTKSIVLKLKNFENTYDDSKPLPKCLMFHYKMETNCTVFTTEDSWSLLLGDQKLVYPKDGGKTFFCATQLFCDDAKTFDLYMKSVNAISFYENIYYYKNAVIFLDNYDIPYPGGNYFSPHNKSNLWYRICFLLFDIDSIQKLENEFQHRKNIYSMPLKIKPAEANISNFIKIKLVNEIKFPETYYESTNIILKRKCFKNPDFIIQDILDSYPHSSEVGIIIEYPVLISYLGTNVSDKHRRFLALAINCNIPKTILYVPSPFDRYYQYRHTPKEISWVTLLYDQQITPPDMNLVILDKTIIGYSYKNTFFCLTHPKLLNGNAIENKNTSTLLNMLTFDLKLDKNFQIVYNYRFDSNHTLHCVKHKDLNHELWCMSLADNFTSYPKHIVPSYLVRNWCDFLLEHFNNKHINFGDLKLVKLMFILARHKICFLTRESKTRDIIYENYKDIIFKLERNVLDFVNTIRLDLIMPNRENENESGCIIL